MDNEKLRPDDVLLFEALPMPATLIDAQGVIVGLNQASVDLAARIGIPITREDRIGRPIMDFAKGEEDRQRLAALVQDTLNTGKSGYLLWPHLDAAGRPFWVEFRLHAVRGPEGRVIGGLVLREDVTERIRREARQQGRERLRDHLWRMTTTEDLEGLMQAVYREIVALCPAVSACSVQLVHPPDQSWRSYQVEVDRVRLLTDIQPPGRATEECWRTRRPVLRRDLRAEDLYGEAEEIWDRERGYSPAVRAVLDVPLPQGSLAVNSHQPEAFTPDDVALVEEMAQLLADGLARAEDLERLSRRNRALEEEVAERRETEQALHQSEERFRQAQKMEAMGHLAAGVAHDFNNLLTAVMGFAELGRKLIADGEPVASVTEMLAEILRAGERGRDLTGQLLAFGRRQPGQVEVVDLNRLISGLRTMLRQLLGEEIELVTRLEPELVQVEGDAGQLQQVLVNLVANARDAMPQGGRVTIATVNREVVEPQDAEGGPVVPGRYALLKVSDTGTGIAPEIKARIFEPFFTTKEGGQGTGLGLAMAYGTATQHRGHLSVESEWGEGATFSLYLPASERAEAIAPSVTPAPEMAARRGPVLVVDDEPSVRSVVARLLRVRGYEVRTAGSGQEAIEMAMGGPEVVRLLVTDVAMPGMSGQELAATLRALLPDLRILYISGYAEGALSEAERTRPGADFLQKPLMPDELTERVRRLLDAKLSTQCAGSGVAS